MSSLTSCVTSEEGGSSSKTWRSKNKETFVYFNAYCKEYNVNCSFNKPCLRNLENLHLRPGNTWRWCMTASRTSPPLRFGFTNSHSSSQSLHGSFTSHPATRAEVCPTETLWSLRRCHKWFGLMANVCTDISGNLLFSWWNIILWHWLFCWTGCHRCPSPPVSFVLSVFWSWHLSWNEDFCPFVQLKGLQCSQKKNMWPSGICGWCEGVYTFGHLSVKKKLNKNT